MQGAVRVGRPGLDREGAEWLLSEPACGAVAQLGERLDRTQEVRGSSPLSSIVLSSYRRVVLVFAPWCNWQHA